jgi:hypothetical protein
VKSGFLVPEQSRSRWNSGLRDAVKSDQSHGWLETDVIVAASIRGDKNHGRTYMKYLFGITAVLLASTAPIQFASAQETPIDLVKSAVAAEGGADALKALKSISIKGEAKHWEPGQSYSAGGEARFLGDTTFTTTWDLAKGAAKIDVDRAMKYPAVETLKYSEVITPSLGFVTDAKGSTAASDNRIAAQLRELERTAGTQHIPGCSIAAARSSSTRTATSICGPASTTKVRSSPLPV